MQKVFWHGLRQKREASSSMQNPTSTSVLGALDTARFLRRYWQRQPLLIRQAVRDTQLLPRRAAVFGLAGREDVESRLVQHRADGSWKMSHGPFARRALPGLTQRGWTLLVQGVDLQDDATRALLDRFRFIPDARIDDAMISFATDGGGVGAHVDSYDVFLLQIHGRRRWRIGPASGRPRHVEGLPLRILADFTPTQEHLLDPGDMLYLPPGYAHEGVAVGECMTCSIGFRAPAAGELARELLQRIADEPPDDAPRPAWERALYVDRGGVSDNLSSAEIPLSLQEFAMSAAARLMSRPTALYRALGQYLTEPEAQLWFDAGDALSPGCGIRLDRKTRMLYDERHIYINGDTVRATGADARLLRLLARQRWLEPLDVSRASVEARELLGEWSEAGWLHRQLD